MSGDYSRRQFDPQRDFTGILMQQGRVQLDSDWNEQVEILDRHQRAETLDVVGRCGVPSATPQGFQIGLDADGQLTIGRGRIYVDGLLAENHGGGTPEFDTVLAESRGSADTISFGSQPYVPLPAPLPKPGKFLIYLDVWQREVTFLDAPDLIEKAVGVDTTARLQTVWQVKVLPDSLDGSVNCGTPDEKISGWPDVIRPSAGRLSNAVVDAPGEQGPCLLPPTVGYRGLENRLYRVEIHQGGAKKATFKWSRDNASVVAAVTAIPTLDKLIVDQTGRDSVLRFNNGDWIEIADDVQSLSALPDGMLPGVMRKIKFVNPATRTIELETPLPANVFATTSDMIQSRHTRIRRWDQTGADVVASKGVLPIPDAGKFMTLEDGIQVSFSTDPKTKKGEFHVGDYWVFAARTVDATIDELQNAPPRGLHHHFGRLALTEFDGKVWKILSDCREVFPSLTELTSLHYVSGDGQEMAPDADESKSLCGPLQVRVLNGGRAVPNAKITFQVQVPQPPGAAKLMMLDGTQAAAELTLTTDANGLAACRWHLDADIAQPCQRVAATLLNRQGLPVAHQQVLFNGRLDVAGFGEPGLTRIVATSWKHGGSESDLFPIDEADRDANARVAGVGFVIAFSDRVTVPRADYDHVFEVLIPPPLPSSTSQLVRGDVPFTFVDLAPQSIYQCWCPLRTGHDAAGRPLGKIVPVNCTVKEQTIVKAVRADGKPANGIALLLEPNSITHALVNQAALFDQFWIRLRCDFVVDQKGRAVDGEFLRAELPSGDRPVKSSLGVQGGLFESWFTFRGSFRGGHMVPLIRGQELTVTVVSFWRKTKAITPVLFASINGGPDQFLTPLLTQADDVTDKRFDVRVTTHTLGLRPGTAQTIDIRWNGFNRISHVPNTTPGSFTLRSRIQWQGQPSTPANPISFDLRKVPLNVGRGRPYEARLGASSPDKLQLTYDLELGENITQRAPGLVINPETGLMAIDGPGTNEYRDNLINPGGDFALSGTIRASNGSFVAFEGMFDGGPVID